MSVCTKKEARSPLRDLLEFFYTFGEDLKNIISSLGENNAVAESTGESQGCHVNLSFKTGVACVTRRIQNGIMKRGVNNV
jgi:hypothetical protein